MNAKQMVNKLAAEMFGNLDYSSEQVELVVKLKQSFETDVERAERIVKFNAYIANAVDENKKYN
jgi:hypothetical protein